MLNTPMPTIRTERMMLRLPEPRQAALMARFRRDNSEFLQPWEPTRPAEFFTEPYWIAQLRQAIREYRDGHSMCLAMMDIDESRIIGVCNFSNVVRGTFQACHLSYAVAERDCGQGLMQEALRGAIPFAFDNLRLHRIMANYMPRNARSAAVLRALGFRIEGLAHSYLQINGAWEDHVLCSLINPAH